MKRATTISRPVEIGLRFIGMWPDSAYPNVYWSMYMTMIVILQYFQYSYIVVHFNMSNLIPLADCLGITLANSLGFFKLFSLRWNRRIFHNILAAMDRDWNDRVINHSYSIMMSHATKSRRCSVVLIGNHILAGFVLTIVAYIFRPRSNAGGEVSREFPMKMEFTFAVLESPLFECILAVQMFYILSLASVVGMINALLATLVSIR
ncbi:PREDICTED: uncharacterized protein LOC105559022 [Vollenhovia emeryi]|uniref:uncharacterized protein LOC105559022 n=1 Tax=Vollenhovia emeryi TaxID=411798 RepID=UPI0005F47B1F|nr:PREDICTED: uncharacterized protein LOC105559022 [Vollenhovia emeryi]